MNKKEMWVPRLQKLARILGSIILILLGIPISLACICIGGPFLLILAIAAFPFWLYDSITKPNQRGSVARMIFGTEE